MALTIRKAQPFEAPLIMDYLQKRFIVAGTQDRSTITMRDIHEAFFERAYAFALIAFEDDNPVGLATYYYNFSTLTGKRGYFIEDLYIEPEARGKGYGKKLFQRIFENAKSEGVEKLDWHCMIGNTRAIELYKKLGAERKDDKIVFTLEKGFE